MADYSNLTPRIRDLYNREQGNLTFTSGYRSPQYNEKVGGAKNSQHTHGNALDISTAGMSPQEVQELVYRLQREYGVTGIGVYGDSIHVDFGAPRAWGSDYTRGTAPEWAKSLVAGLPPGSHGGHQHAGLPGHDQAGIGHKDEPMVPLWEQMQRNDQGQFGKAPEGMVRVPGTGLALNQAGLGAALQAFGSSFL